jgi:hypothetical protein
MRHARAKATNMASTKTSNTTAAKATHVATTKLAAHMAAAATTVSSAASAACLGTGGKKAAGQYRACQNHHHSSSHDILLWNGGLSATGSGQTLACPSKATASATIHWRWECSRVLSTKFSFNHPN